MTPSSLEVTGRVQTQFPQASCHWEAVWPAGLPSGSRQLSREKRRLR